MAVTSPQHTINRRRFLIGSSALVVGAGLAPLAMPALAQRPARQPSDAAWRQLADRLSGPVLRAASFNLAQIARPYNLRYVADLPDGIALCRTPISLGPTPAVNTVGMIHIATVPITTSFANLTTPLICHLRRSRAGSAWASRLAGTAGCRSSRP